MFKGTVGFIRLITSAGVDDHSSYYEGRVGLKALVQPVGCVRLGFAEQCALMCFTGLTADSDEAIDDTLWLKEKKKSLVPQPGERRLFRSLQTLLCFLLTL